MSPFSLRPKAAYSNVIDNRKDSNIFSFPSHCLSQKPFSNNYKNKLHKLIFQQANAFYNRQSGSDRDTN